MSSVIKKRSGYINEEQKNCLVEFMGRNPELQSGKFSSNFTFKHAQKLWEQLTSELNEIPGAIKEWKQWRKTWQDMRSATKSKHTSVKNHAKGTGGGPASSQVLTDMDQHVLALIGATAVEGHDTIHESVIQFNFDEGAEPSNIEYLPDDEETVKSSLVEYTSKELVVNNKKSLTNNISSLQLRTSIPIAPIPNSSSTNKTGVKRTSAALSYDKSIEQTAKLAKISQNDSDMRKLYYERKLDLYAKEIELRERDVVSKENTNVLLHQFNDNVKNLTSVIEKLIEEKKNQ